MKGNILMKSKTIIASAIVISIILLSVCLLTGCNKQIFDTTYSFNYVVMSLPNGEVIEGTVDSWTDFEDGDQLQVKVDGIMYLVHSTDCVLIKK